MTPPPQIFIRPLPPPPRFLAGIMYAFDVWHSIFERSKDDDKQSSTDLSTEEDFIVRPKNGEGRAVQKRDPRKTFSSSRNSKFSEVRQLLFSVEINNLFFPDCVCSEDELVVVRDGTEVNTSGCQSHLGLISTVDGHDQGERIVGADHVDALVETRSLGKCKVGQNFFGQLMIPLMMNFWIVFERVRLDALLQHGEDSVVFSGKLRKKRENLIY